MTRRQVLACAAAMLAAALVYLNALDNPFVYDDFRVVVENRALLGLSDLPVVLLHDISRPLVNLSYAIDLAIWGGGPIGFHLTNLFLHVINVGLFFLLVLHLISDERSARRDTTTSWKPVAFLAACAFAVHPLMTGAVGYISGRSELLCGTFFLLAFISVRQWISHRGGAGWLAAAIGCWLLALASKEIAVVFPLLVFWYERFSGGGSADERQRRLWLLHAPLLGLAGLAAAARVAVFVLAEHPDGARIVWQYGLVELDVIRQYMTLLLVPSGQAIFHEVNAISGLLDWRAWPGLLVVGTVVAIAWILRRRSPMVSVGFAWFLLVLAPSSVLVMLDRGEPMAEHRVYLASCGLFLVAGCLIGKLSAHVVRPSSRLVLRVVLAALLVALAGGTIARNEVWADPVDLWSEASAKAPDAWLPHLLLGEAQHNAGRHAEAIASYRTVIRLRPEGAAGYARIGVCLTELGQFAEASDVYAELEQREPTAAEAQNGMGVIALMSDQPEEARRRFRATLAMHPQNVEARRGLVLLAESVDDDPAEALRLCQEIAVLSPLAPGNDDCIVRNRARVGGSGS